MSLAKFLSILEGVPAVKRAALGAIALFCVAPTLAIADPFATPDPTLDQSVYAFGGRYLTSMAPWDPYEDNYVIGGGYQQFFLELADDPVFGLNLKFGVDAGAAIRLSSTNTGELWAAGIARLDGITIADTIHVAPSAMLGLSYVTGVMPGRERAMQIEVNGDPTLIFYVAYELNFSLVDYPQAEFFYRIHHRSGAWGTLGGTSLAADANTLGVRWQF